MADDSHAVGETPKTRLGASELMKQAKDTILDIKDQDARLGLSFSLVFALILFFLILYYNLSTGVDTDHETIIGRVWSLLWRFVLVGVALTLFFRVIDNTWVARALTIFLSSIAGLTILLGWVQFVTNNGLPKVVHLSCAYSPLDEGCPLGPERPAAVVQTAAVVPIVEQIPFTNSSQDQAPQPNITILDPTVLEPMVEPRSLGGTTDAQIRNSRVYIHFAGSINRDAIKAVAARLAAQNWNIQGEARGGERTAVAVGYKEIRYFHDTDAALAQAALDAFNAALGADEQDLALIQTRSLAGRYDVPIGQLEIYTSR